MDRAGYAARVPPVAVLTPFGFPSVRGNAITAERVVAGLRERGLRVSAWDLSTTPEADVAAAVEACRPALVHAFHAYRSGPLALRLARRLEVPLVVTLTGPTPTMSCWIRSTLPWCAACSRAPPR